MTMGARMTEPQEPQQVVVVDVKVPFWSMVFLMVKWALASIPRSSSWW